MEETINVKVNADTVQAEANLQRLADLNERASAQRPGYKSSKFQLAVFGMVLLALVFLFVVLKTGSAAGFGEFCIAEVSLAATFSGSRVAESFAAMRGAGAGPK